MVARNSKPLMIDAALVECRALFPELQLVASIRDCGGECITMRGTTREYSFQIGLNGIEFDADTLDEAMDQVRAYHTLNSVLQARDTEARNK